jgi:hypothetical protein
MNTRAVDDFESIRDRVEQLQRERHPAPGTARIAAASSRFERPRCAEMGWFLRGLQMPKVTMGIALSAIRSTLARPRRSHGNCYDRGRRYRWI